MSERITKEDVEQMQRLAKAAETVFRLVAFDKFSIKRAIEYAADEHRLDDEDFEELRKHFRKKKQETKR